jgi:hypothetical protein
VIEELAVAALAGRFDDCGGIMLPTSAEPREPKSAAYLNAAWELYQGPGDLEGRRRDFLHAYIEEALITREATAGFMNDHAHPWPKSLGAVPKMAPTTPAAGLGHVSLEVKRIEGEQDGARDEVAATSLNKGGRPPSRQKMEFMREAARNLGIIDQSKFTTLDELRREMKKAARGAHEPPDKPRKIPTCPELLEDMAQWSDDIWGRGDDAPGETAIKNWKRELRELYEG